MVDDKGEDAWSVMDESMFNEKSVAISHVEIHIFVGEV